MCPQSCQYASLTKIRALSSLRFGSIAECSPLEAHLIEIHGLPLLFALIFLAHSLAASDPHDPLLVDYLVILGVKSAYGSMFPILKINYIGIHSGVMYL